MGLEFHTLMFPWFAFGHMIPFLHVANKLAKKGHRVTFLLPRKAKSKLEHLNLYPDNILLEPVSVPDVDGLPKGTETASDIPLSLCSLLASAMDLTRDQVEAATADKKPDLIVYDFAHWIPDLARQVGAKTVCYSTESATCIAGFLPERCNKRVTVEDLARPPPGYPYASVVLRGHEAQALSFALCPFGEGVTFYERNVIALIKCDAIAIRTCREVEEKFVEFIESQYRKRVLLTGPMFPDDPDKTPKPQGQEQEEDRWGKWLSGFEPGSVVFCAFGSQVILDRDQFQELCLAMELTGHPFLVALKPPEGASTVQEALPKGFEERVKGRGVVYGGWAEQTRILSHPSVGCFVSHCGFGSMWESLVSDCQIVLVPHLPDQILHTRLMVEELKVAVEVQRDEETREFSRESLINAIDSVMDGDDEIGKMVRKNHRRLKESLVGPGCFDNYEDNFIEELQNLVHE